MKVAVAVGVRVILTISTCTSATGSLDEKAWEIVGVPYQANNAAATATKISIIGSIVAVKSDLVLVIEAADGFSIIIGSRILGGGGFSLNLWIAQCIPCLARSLPGFISRARLRYSRLASGGATAASRSQASSSSGSNFAACWASFLAPLRFPRNKA